MSHEGAAPCEAEGSVLPTATEDVTLCGNIPTEDAQPAPKSWNCRKKGAGGSSVSRTGKPAITVLKSLLNLQG